MIKAPLRKQLPDIGRLDKRISILHDAVSRDPAGAEKVVWQVKCEVWAMVDYPKTGSDEDYEGGSPGAIQFATRAVTFTIRRLKTLNEKDRIRYEGEDYDIEVIAVLGRNRFQQIKTKLRR